MFQISPLIIPVGIGTFVGGIVLGWAILGQPAPEEQASIAVFRSAPVETEPAPASVSAKPVPTEVKIFPGRRLKKKPVDRVVARSPVAQPVGDDDDDDDD